jgi:hypothetical protein
MGWIGNVRDPPVLAPGAVISGGTWISVLAEIPCAREKSAERGAGSPKRPRILNLIFRRGALERLETTYQIRAAC